MQNEIPFLIAILDRRIQSQREVWRGMGEAADAAEWSYPIEELPQLQGRIDVRSCLGMVLWSWRSLTEEYPFPVINLSNRAGPREGCGNLLNEDRAIGQLAARHLLINNYSRYLVLGPPQYQYAVQRIAGFRAEMERNKSPLQTVDFPRSKNRPSWEEWNPQVFMNRMSEELVDILQDLPPDTGIFAIDHPIAQHVEHCLFTHFPERLHTTGLLAGDLPVNFRWLPGERRSISCVQTANAARGRAAMEWFVGQEKKPQPVTELCRYFPPEGIWAQVSTAGPACQHPTLAWGIRWSWQRIQAGQPPTVEELAGFLKMSSRSLNRLFQEELAKTARDFLLHLRMEKAAQSLLQSPFPSVQEVAEKAGFTNQGAFTSAFRSWSGQNPREYRKAKD